MKGCMSTDLGIITIDPEVIAKYAGTVAVECFGIVGMAAVNMKDGLVHLLKKESLTRGIKVRISEDNHVSLSFHIIVAYGVSISAVTDNLISNVKYRVEEFSGMPVDKINIYNEDGEDVSSKYPLFCQRVKDCVPSYKDVENDLMEANMSDTELYFGSEDNYLHYKYGN